MTERETYVTQVHSVSGGQVATGKYISQTQTVIPAQVLGSDDFEQLTRDIAALREQVIDATPPERRNEGADVVAELEETLVTGPPDPSRLEYVKGWIARHAPAALGTISHLIAGPIVAKLVEAAGEAVVAQFKARFDS
jgi:hypothetical protein